MSEGALPLLPAQRGPRFDVCVRMLLVLDETTRSDSVRSGFDSAGQSWASSQPQRNLEASPCVLRSTLQWTVRGMTCLRASSTRTLRVALSSSDARAGVAGQDGADHFDEGFWDGLVQEPPRHSAGERPPFCLRFFGSGDLTALLCGKSWEDVHRSVIKL